MVTAAVFVRTLLFGVSLAAKRKIDMDKLKTALLALMPYKILRKMSHSSFNLRDDLNIIKAAAV